MTQRSWFWPTDYVGDGYPIDQESWPAVFGSIFAPFSGNDGMGMAVPDQGGAASNMQILGFTTRQITVQIGYALVGGIFYANDAAFNVQFTAEQWGDFANHNAYIRIPARWLTRVCGFQASDVASTSAPPNSGGDIGDEAFFTVARVSYRYGPGDPVPIIASVFNYYNSQFGVPGTEFDYYLQNASHIMLHRQGGSATVWPTAGTTNYPMDYPCKIETVIITAAALGMSGTEAINVAGSDLFGREAIIQVTCLSSAALATLGWGLYYNGGLARWEIQWTNSSNDTPVFMVMGIRQVIFA